jgi:putative membrane protein
MKKSTIIKTYFKGIIMGVADLVPGISGGTLAFIMGIYERLIHAITQINFTNSKVLFSLLFKEKGFNFFWNKFKEIDFFFLLILFLGILTSILTFSKGIHFLYENYTAYTLTFFVGLILGSIKLIYDDIPRHKVFNYIFGIGGFLLGLSLLYLKELTQINPGILMLFFSGFFAVAALFLPGISGSFILLILGMYTYVLALLQNIFSNIFEISIFIFGAIFGMITISRLISYLFSQDKAKTLYVLLGFVIGSLSIPLKVIIPTVSSSNVLNYWGLLFAGLLIVILLTIISNKKNQKKSESPSSVEKV